MAETAVARTSLFAPTRDRALIMLWLLGAALVGLAVYSIAVDRGFEDSLTYWSAWTRGQLYGLHPGQAGAYLYTPVFAQVIYPLTLLPWPAFALVWLALAVSAYLWLLRPLPAVWAIPLFAFGVEDLRVGNIVWLLAVACALGTRRPETWLVGLFTKLSTVVGVLWFVPRRDWRALARVAVWGLVILAASVAVSPGLWREWFAFATSARGVGAPVRLVFAAGIALLAGRRGWAWLLPLALAVASPFTADYLLGFACAVPRLLPADALAWMSEPFGGFRATVRRALDLP